MPFWGLPCAPSARVLPLFGNFGRAALLVGRLRRRLLRRKGKARGLSKAASFYTLFARHAVARLSRRFPRACPPTCRGALCRNSAPRHRYLRQYIPAPIRPPLSPAFSRRSFPPRNSSPCGLSLARYARFLLDAYALLAAAVRIVPKPRALRFQPLRGYFSA